MITIIYKNTILKTDNSSIGLNVFLDLLDAAEDDVLDDDYTTENIKVNDQYFTVKKDCQYIYTKHGKVPYAYIDYAFLDLVNDSDL